MTGRSSLSSRCAFVVLAAGVAVVASADPPASAPAVVPPVPPPALMVKLVTRDASPGVDPASFAGRPKTIYRAGPYYLRLEEAEDAANGIHGLIVVNNRDSWMINRLDRTARHVRDTGPTFESHAPLLPAGRTPGPFDPLEYGTEPAFLKAHPEFRAAKQPAGGATTTYAFKAGENDVEFVVHADDLRPIEARIRTAGGPTQVVKYDEYVTNAKYDAALFMPPAGLRTSEAKAD